MLVTSSLQWDWDLSGFSCRWSEIALVRFLAWRRHLWNVSSLPKGFSSGGMWLMTVGSHTERGAPRAPTAHPANSHVHHPCRSDCRDEGLGHPWGECTAGRDWRRAVANWNCGPIIPAPFPWGSLGCRMMEIDGTSEAIWLDLDRLSPISRVHSDGLQRSAGIGNSQSQGQVLERSIAEPCADAAGAPRRLSDGGWAHCSLMPDPVPAPCAPSHTPPTIMGLNTSSKKVHILRASLFFALRSFASPTLTLRGDLNSHAPAPLQLGWNSTHAPVTVLTHGLGSDCPGRGFRGFLNSSSPFLAFTYHSQIDSTWFQIPTEFLFEKRGCTWGYIRVSLILFFLMLFLFQDCLRLHLHICTPANTNSSCEFRIAWNANPYKLQPGILSTSLNCIF